MIELLPIDRPLEHNKYTPLDFYNNIVCKLIPDILKLEDTGIPIDLTKVQKLEEIVNEVLNNVDTVLSTNPLMTEFLNTKNSVLKNKDKEIISTKKKTYENYLKPFDVKNKVHRSYVVNLFLTKNNYNDYLMDEWSLKDLKKLNQIISSKFIQDLIDKNIQSYMSEYIDEAMIALATEKANIYNKNIDDRMITNESKGKYNIKFNPASSTQKQEFFDWLDIESESETKTGAPQWNRKELERLQKLLTIMIDDKNNEQ